MKSHGPHFPLVNRPQIVYENTTLMGFITLNALYFLWYCKTFQVEAQHSIQAVQRTSSENPLSQLPSAFKSLPLSDLLLSACGSVFHRVSVTHNPWFFTGRLCHLSNLKHHWPLVCLWEGTKMMFGNFCIPHCIHWIHWKILRH